MFCIKCGTKLPDESKFCVSCGKKIKSISEPKPRGKVCPYCKKTIPQNSASCPECNRALVENVGRRRQEIKSQSQTSYKPPVAKSKLNLKPLVIIIIVLFFGYLIFSEDTSTSDSSSSSGSSLNTRQPLTQALENKQKPTPDPFRENFSLPNNTVIDSNSLYQLGNGELNIKNGTSYDAVAKLVKSSLSKSVYTVYIKSDNKVTIKNIPDGIYDLYFVHGQDWDTENKDFNYSKSYSKFEDSFNFETKETRQYDGIYEEYTIFEVTLHGVIGGTAETETVSEAEFSNF